MGLFADDAILNKVGDCEAKQQDLDEIYGSGTVNGKWTLIKKLA